MQATIRESRALKRMAQETTARARATRAQILRGRSRREVLHDSAFARLQAKHKTMPVIEQAKGILMGLQRCGPREAFDLLRQASQRTNIKVHVLAAQIVEHIASDDDNRDTYRAGCHPVPAAVNPGHTPRLGDATRCRDRSRLPGFRKAVAAVRVPSRSQWAVTWARSDGLERQPDRR